MNIILDHALKLASTGKPVFPCRPDNKSPFVKGGFKAATTDEEQIRAWWYKWPAAMIGMPTGPASGVWVLDVDAAKEGETGDGYASLAELTAKQGQLPPTRTHVTPGGGQHLLFKYPIGREIRSSASKISSRLDIRGCGGYIIMPPSVNAADKAYTVMDSSKAADAPGWLLDIVAPLPKAKNDKPQMPQPHHNNGLTTYAQAAIAGELSMVSSAPRGSRNAALNTASFSLGRWIGGGALPEQDAHAMLFQAAQSCGLVADDGEHAVLKTIQSGLNSGKKEPRHAPVSSRNDNNCCNTTRQDMEAVKESESISVKHFPSPPPVPMEAFPPPIAALLKEAAEAFSVPLQIPAACMLAFLSTCVGGSRHIFPKNSWAEPGSLWLGLVAESGTGKSPVANAFFRSIYDYESELFVAWEEKQKAYLREYGVYKNTLGKAKCVDELPAEPRKPHKREYYLDDMTSEAMSNTLSENPRGVMLLKDELSGFVAEMSRYSAKGDDGTKDRMLTAYNGGPWKISRASKPDIFCRHALVGIFGTIQPGMLPRIFDAEKGGADEASGFLQRFILVRAERAEPKQWVEKPFSQESQNLLHSIVHHLLKWDVKLDGSGQIQKNCVHISDTARTLYINWYNQIAKEGFLSDNPSLLDKLHAHALRLCLLLHCLDAAIASNEGMNSISVDTMQRALMLAEWVKLNQFQCWTFFKPGKVNQVSPIERTIMQVVVKETARIEADGGKISNERLFGLVKKELGMPELSHEKLGRAASALGLSSCSINKGDRGRIVTPEKIHEFKMAVGSVGTVGTPYVAATKMSTSIISQQSASVSEAHPSWAEPTVVGSAVTVDGEPERVDVQALPTPPTVPTDSPGCNPEFDFNDPAYPDEDRVII